MPRIRRIRYTFSSFGYTRYTSAVHGNIYSVHMETIKKGSSTLFIYICSVWPVFELVRVSIPE